MCAQTRPSDQGCLHCRLAFALPLTASSDACSTQPGTLDQGCLYCRLAFVLPLRTRIGCLQTNSVLNQLSDKEANPLPAMPTLNKAPARPSQVLGIRGRLYGRPVVALVLTRLSLMGVSML